MAKQPKPKDRPAPQKQRKNKGHENIKPHQWKKGQSGNPGGRPRGRSITARLRERLDADDGKLAELIVKVMIREAAKGKFQFAKEILERTEGKVADKARVELSGPDGNAIKVAACEVRAKIEAQLDDDDRRNCDESR